MKIGIKVRRDVALNVTGPPLEPGRDFPGRQAATGMTGDGFEPGVQDRCLDDGFYMKLVKQPEIGAVRP